MIPGGAEALDDLAISIGIEMARVVRIEQLRLFGYISVYVYTGGPP